MKAVLIERYGGPEVLRCADVERPRILPTEVLVRVRASGVCFHDLLIRQGKYKNIQLPCIPGHEVAGEVAEVGSAVFAFREGERVVVAAFLFCGICPSCRQGRTDECETPPGAPGTQKEGGYAEYLRAPAVCLTRLPEGIPWEEAAAIPCAAATALDAVRNVARVGPGDKVLVTGAAGGVGVHAVQIARFAGAEVIAATGSKEKAARLQELGAHHVVCGPADRLAAQVKVITGGRGATAVIECVGTATLEASLRSLRAGGRLALIGAVTGDAVPVKPAVLVLKNLTIRGSSRQADLAEVVEWVAAGRLRLVVPRVLPLEEAAEAHRLLESRASFGRVALRP